METKKYYTLEILENGVIQLLIQTAYVKENGEELVRENWRTCLNPGDFEQAEELLDDYHMGIVRAAWTNDIIEKYIKEVEEKQKNKSVA